MVPVAVMFVVAVIAPVTATDASLTLSGPAAADDAKRFYRVVTMP
jgi:hypothetical protein